MLDSELKSKITNPHLANNIINGITLNNYIEVFIWRKENGETV